MVNKNLVCENCGKTLPSEGQVCQFCEPELVVNYDIQTESANGVKQVTLSPISVRIQIWIAAIFYGVMFFWSELSAYFPFEISYPFTKASALLKGLVLTLTIGVAIVISMRKYYLPSTLFFSAGMFIATSIVLFFNATANTGFIVLWFTGLTLFREGKCSLALYNKS